MVEKIEKVVNHRAVVFDTEKICINCNKPVINCSYSRNDNEIIPEHSSASL